MKTIFDMIYGIKRFFLLSLAVSGLSLASAADEADTKPDIEPEAAKVIHSVSEYLKSLGQFSLDVCTDVRINAEGVKQEFSIVSALSFVRPDKLAYKIKSGLAGSNVFCDGDKIRIYTPSSGAYSEERAPENLAEFPLETNSDGVPVVKIFISEDPEKEILNGVLNAEYAGIQNIDGADCHHIKFKQVEVDWDMWVLKGDKPLVHKIVPDFNKLMKRSAEADLFKRTPILDNMEYCIGISFRNWNTEREIPDDEFKFSRPDIGKESASLPDSSKIRPGQKKERSLLAKPAPEFKLKTAGGEFSLADHRNKNVVVLGFWNSFYPACGKAVPLFTEITNDYGGKPIVVCAVNQGEKSDKVKLIVSKEKISYPVAIDTGSETAGLYFTDSFPQTVIIGKDGTVQAVHSGDVKNLKEIVYREIEKLLKDESIVADKPLK